MYRENIREVIEQSGENISTIVVPKNSGLKGYAWQVLKEAGLDLEQAEQVSPQTYQCGDLSVVLKRGEDIPQLVRDYAQQKDEVVLGVTGDDLFDEYRLQNPDAALRLENTYDWDDDAAMFRRPALCFISKTGSVDDIPLDARVALNGKYERTSQQYLEKSPLTVDRSFQETLYYGDVEITVAEGTQDCCFDQVYSGKTLQENGLNIIEVVRYSDLAVISPLGEMPDSGIGRAMEAEYARILDRLENPTDSYTSKLLQDPEKLGKKLQEESLEVILSLFGLGDTTQEGADLFYAATMAMVRGGVALEDLAQVMRERQR